MGKKLLRAANCFLLNQRGATAIEYGLIAALISIAIIAGITMTGTDMGNTFNNLGNSLD